MMSKFWSLKCKTTKITIATREKIREHTSLSSYVTECFVDLQISFSVRPILFFAIISVQINCKENNGIRVYLIWDGLSQTRCDVNKRNKFEFQFELDYNAIVLLCYRDSMGTSKLVIS